MTGQRNKSISVIVPMYNEEHRIIPFLKNLTLFMHRNYNEFEIILVDDGSTDRTINVVNNFLNYDNIRLESYEVNRGKGFAVKYGIDRSVGDYILFIDADGSTPPYEIERMISSLEEYEVVIGTRQSKASKAKGIFYRRILSFCFNTYVTCLFQLYNSDYLCGFKGFRKESIEDVFDQLISDRWIFDVEILYKSKKKSLSVHELPISWVHKDGSKLKLNDIISMFSELIDLRLKLI